VARERDPSLSLHQQVDGLTTSNHNASGGRSHKRTGSPSCHRRGVMSGSDQMSTQVTDATTPSTGTSRTTQQVVMTTTPTVTTTKNTTKTTTKITTNTATKTTTETFPRLASTATNETFKCVHFNCKGFKQSIDYIANLLHSNDIVCLTETWLRPGELSGIHLWLKLNPMLLGVDFDVYAKSAMEDINDLYTGRPYGGVAIICKKHNLFSAREIDSPSDRTITIELFDCNNKIMHIICNVYMPYYDKSKCTQTNDFIDTIDVLQSLIDRYNVSHPIKFVGDFNSQLPRKNPGYATWYRGEGFNNHSLILHNFMMANNLISADLLGNSKGFTYFCHTRNVYTWIDHVLCAEFDSVSITSCLILDHVAENVSDHLPICTQMIIPPLDKHPTGDYAPQSGRSHDTHSPANWGNSNHNVLYKAILENQLSNLGEPNLSDMNSQTDAQAAIDKYICDINKAFHSSASEAGCVSTKHFKPKPYWCPELSELRNKKRFWWRLWGENGRPRSGAVFDCYKGIKRMFRSYSRKCMANVLTNKFSTFNNLFQKKKFGSFWKSIRNSKKTRPNSKLDPALFKARPGLIQS